MTSDTVQTVPARVSLALADRLFEAIAANDLQALRDEIYTPDIAVWHNNDDHDQLVDENLAVLDWLHRKVKDKRYEDIVRHVTPTGFVEQHILRGVAPDGSELNIHACLVVTVVGDRIHRIDEYLDSSAARSLFPTDSPQ